MKIKKLLIKNKNRVLIHSMLILTCLFITVFLILFYIDIKVNNSKKEDLLKNETQIIELEAEGISAVINDVLGDLHFLEDVYLMHLGKDKEFFEINEIWQTFSEHTKKYDLIRLIDKNGKEAVRINYDNGQASASKKTYLPDKKDKVYSYEMTETDKNFPYLSKINLNMKNNKIEEPAKPIIRFSMKVYNKNGEYAGTIALNYLAENLLKEFDIIGSGSIGNLYLINSDGYWITGGNKIENWAFMYSDRKKITFKNKFPLEWKEINKGNKMFITKKGTFTWTEIDFKKMYYENHNANEVILGDGNFRIISFIDKSNKTSYIFAESMQEKIYRILKENIITFILIGIITIMIESIVIIIEKAYLKMRYIADHDGLTEVLNRRAGLEIIEKSLDRDSRRKSNRISVCFVDVNGLKQVNDQLGHDCGDELIITVADTIKKIIRENDFVIRFGGDEFLIVFMDSEMSISENIWKRIMEEFERINITENRKYLISVSHGIADSDALGEKIADRIIQTADEKMYKEKKVIKSGNFSVIRK